MVPLIQVRVNEIKYINMAEYIYSVIFSFFNERLSLSDIYESNCFSCK